MKPRLLEAHPLVEEARNQVAVMRGPLVYCLESTDLPKGVGVPDVALPRDVEAHAAVRPGPARRRRGARREGGARGRAAVGRRTVPRVQARRAEAGRREADPVLRLGQPRQVRDDRLDAPGALTDDDHACDPSSSACSLAAWPRVRPTGRGRGRAVGTLRADAERARRRQPVRRRGAGRHVHAGRHAGAGRPGSTTATASYRVRFMPDDAGRVDVHDREQPPRTGRQDRQVHRRRSRRPATTARCACATRFHFAYADGTPYFPVGTTCYAWTHQGDELEEQTLATLKAGAVQQAADVRVPEVVRLQQERAAALPVRGHAAEQVGLRPLQPGVLPPPRNSASASSATSASRPT